MRQKTKTIMKKLLILLLVIPLIGFSQTETKREYYESGKIELKENLKVKSNILTEISHVLM
jgi:hypothetical protein